MIDPFGLSEYRSNNSGIGIYEAEEYSGNVDEYDVSEPVEGASNYSMTARYQIDGDNKELLYYVAGRPLDEDKADSPENFRNDWIIEPDKINDFRNNATNFERTANLIYFNGFLSIAEKKILSGNAWGGIGDNLRSALVDPAFWVLLGGGFTTYPMKKELSIKTISISDITTLKGATISKVKKTIPPNWITEPYIKKGVGMKFKNPSAKGEQIILNYGYPYSNDPLYQGNHI